jgi:dTDP-4-amino-4,6-dideoxygalactose transaminase
MNKTDFIPLTRPALPRADSLFPKLRDIINSGMITESKYVAMFEEECARLLGVKYVVAVSSGTSALLLLIRSLGLEGEVILPSFTFTSGGHALLWCGIKPVFTDIDRSTFNLDPTVIERNITSRTSAILPTHTFGSPCNIGQIARIAKKHNLKLIFDGAHAFGSLYQNKPVCQYGNATIISLTPTKVFTTGEGGLIATNDKDLAHKLELAKHNGDSFNRNEEFLGLSSRMSEFQAIIGLEGLKIFRKSLRNRIKLVNYYKKKLNGIKSITFQEIETDSFSVYKDLTIVIDDKSVFSRNDLLDELRADNIQTKVYFDPPLHEKKVYAKYRKHNLPNTDYISKHIINLPLSSNMPERDVNRICSIIIKLSQRHK